MQYEINLNKKRTLTQKRAETFLTEVASLLQGTTFEVQINGYDSRNINELYLFLLR